MTQSTSRARGLILEGLVIVASILLAFAVDAWWDARQERQAEERLLTALELEFGQHVDELSESASIHRRLAYLTRSLFDTLEAHADGELLVSDSLVYPTMRARTTEIAQGELEAALTSGALDLVSDRELRGRLAGWPGTWSDATEEEIWAVEFALGRLGDALGESPDVGVSLMEGLQEGRVPTESGSGEPRRIRNSARLRAALATRFTLELGAWYGMEAARSEAQAIRAGLRESLGLAPLADDAPTDATPPDSPPASGPA